MAMDTLKESLTTEVKSMFKDLLEGLKLSTTPLEVVRPATNVSEANPDKGEASSEQASVTKNGSGKFAQSAPPTHYGGPVPTPHLNSVGPPPKFIKNSDFATWVFRFKRHINHCSTNLWRIIEQGFYPYDPDNMTPRETADHQFNESALCILQDSIPPEDIAHL